MFQLRFARFRRGRVFSTRLNRRHLVLEPLERRQLLATDTWNNPIGGSWDVAGNWNNGLPGPSDDVVISDLHAGAAVTISSNVESINSITATDPLDISGGGLTVAANSTLSGGLTMTGGSLTASGSGVSFTVTGTTTLSGASLYAQNGATLSVAGLASYRGGVGYSDTLEATGGGSVLSLPKLTTITEDTSNGNSWTRIQALAGGSVQLAALAQVSYGPVLLESDGSGSQLNVSALASFQGRDGDGNGSTLQASNGGTILDASLATFTQATLPLASGTVSLPLVTDADGSNFLVSGGASLTLPGVTSYAGVVGTTDTLQATGSSSVLSLPKLTTITEDTSNGNSWTRIQALAGGSVQLAALAQVSYGPVLLESDGSGSQLNVSALASFQGRDGDGNGSTLQASNGGTILDASLATFTQATLPLASGTVSLPLVTDADGSNFLVSGGASLTLPGVTSYTGVVGTSDTLQATGGGSVLSLPKLTTITEDTSNGNSWTRIQALAGATVSLPVLPQISSGPVLLESDGSGSQLAVPVMTNFQGRVGDGHGSTLQITNGGNVLDAALASLNGVSLIGNSTGTFTLSASLGLSIAGGTSTVQVGTLIDQGNLSVQSRRHAQHRGRPVRRRLGHPDHRAGKHDPAQRQPARHHPERRRLQSPGDRRARQRHRHEQSAAGTGGHVGGPRGRPGGIRQQFRLRDDQPDGSNTSVELVDLSHNTTSTRPEAVYANELIVPSGATLNLNNLHLYVRGDQISGTIVGGTVSVVPSGGSIALNTPTPGTLTPAGAVDDWTFYGTAGESITVQLNPGGGGSNPAISPSLELGSRSPCWTRAAMTLATASSASSGAIATISALRACRPAAPTRSRFRRPRPRAPAPATTCSRPTTSLPVSAPCP